MRTIGRTALTGLVWLTAAMTLVAGLPHFDCRCPSGQVKPFCLATASKKTGCCCGGACCAGASGGGYCCNSPGSSPERHGHKPPCCAQEKAPPGGNQPFDGPHLDHCGGCVKTLAASPVLTADTHRKPLADDRSAGTAMSVCAVVTCCPACGVQEHLSRLDRPPAPPPDLVTLLQRLVI